MPVHVEKVETIDGEAFVETREARPGATVITYRFRRAAPSAKHPCAHVELVSTEERGQPVKRRLGLGAATRAARRALIVLPARQASASVS